MAMLDRTKSQKVAIHIIVTIMFMSMLVAAVLLIWESSQASQSNDITTYVNIGPLRLVELQKTPIQSGGFQASIKFLPGLLVYFGLWFLVAVFITYLRITKQNKP